jgi:hypothetical protein
LGFDDEKWRFHDGKIGHQQTWDFNPQILEWNQQNVGFDQGILNSSLAIVQ